MEPNSSAKSFYETHYGQRADEAVTRIALKMLGRVYHPSKRPLSILDVGCGDMIIFSQLVEQLKILYPESQIDAEGWDVSEAAIDRARRNGCVARLASITDEVDSSLHDRFDMIVFFEVLEHIANTDQAMRNLYNMLKPDGVLLLSTPNLASWYNRIFLLLGMEPHCMEVSYEHYRFGNPITQKMIKGPPAGHLRLFAWRALKEYLRYFNFEIMAVRGCSNHKLDVVSKACCFFGPEFAGDVCLVARRSSRTAGNERS